MICANIFYQRGGRSVHRVSVPGGVIIVTFMFQSHSVRILGTDVPGLVGFQDHLSDLSVAASQNIMRGGIGAAILEPGDTAGVSSFYIVNGDGSNSSTVT